MTWDENDVLGAMAGWQRCVSLDYTRSGCNHFVEPWLVPGKKLYTGLHATCMLVIFWQQYEATGDTNNVFLLAAIKEASNDLG
jgi:hypothetical protein